MYSYEWDSDTGGYLMTSNLCKVSKEPRPVYYRELELLGFDKYWNYPKSDDAPLMWAESNNYIYKGRNVAKINGGSIYTSPKIDILGAPEEDGQPLQFVDIKKMVSKNRDFVETIAKDTVKKLYNTYVEYKGKVDAFYVAFSGGKDSVVTLDIVMRAIPHNDFFVLFADTGMEFPDTYNLIEKAKKWCLKENVAFYTASSHFKPEESWRLFGPPARKLRWCCSVHKSVPVLNKLYSLLNLKNGMTTVMITGVRSFESISRGDYESLSLGKKISGQYSFHPILDWSSALVYCYLYSRNLIFNPAYRTGFARVGCIMCPNSSNFSEFLKNKLYSEYFGKYCDIIVETSKKDLSGNNRKIFLDTGGWRMRISGRELKESEEKFIYEERKDSFYLELKEYNDDWIQWYKTIGTLLKEDDSHYRLEFDGVWRNLIITVNSSNVIFEIEKLGRNKNSIYFFSFFKIIITKSLYCVRCRLCVSECVFRNIEMSENFLSISDKCTRCRNCLKIPYGCIYYNSVRGGGDIKMSAGGIGSYLTVGVSGEWIRKFFEDQSYDPGNRKTDSLRLFLRNADILPVKKTSVSLTDFGKLIKRIGLDDCKSWGLILCNLAYSSIFSCYIKTIPFDIDYTKSMLYEDLLDYAPPSGTKTDQRNVFWESFKVILDTTPYGDFPFYFGVPNIERKTLSNGSERKTLISIRRGHWKNPDPLVVLYGLYRFAEACDDYKRFDLSTLLDDSIERNGVSPTRIFGIDRDTMAAVLNGLSINYPDFINVSFTHNLESIDLRRDKSSSDVLSLF